MRLVAERDKARIAVGICDGRVRFTNHLTERFNQNNELKGRKLEWFIDYYAGALAGRGVESYIRPVYTRQ